MQSIATLQSQKFTCEQTWQEHLGSVIEITAKYAPLTNSALKALRGTNRDLNRVVARIARSAILSEDFPFERLENLADLKSLTCRGSYNPPEKEVELPSIRSHKSHPLWVRALKRVFPQLLPCDWIDTRLKRLCCRIFGRRLRDADLRFLKDLPSLEQLRLENLEFITDRGLAEIGKLQQLRTLSLRNCLNVTGRGVSDLRCLAQLETIDLTGQTPHQLEQLGALDTLADLSLLQEVKLGPIWQLELETLSHHRIHQKLKSLKIGCVTSDIFTSLTCLSRLENLTLMAFDPEFSATGEAQKFTNLLCLSSLEFFNEYYGFEQLSALYNALATMPQLRALRLGEVGARDVASLIQLTQLESLTIDSDRSELSLEVSALSKVKHLKLGWPIAIGGNVWLSNSPLETLNCRSEFLTLSAITSLGNLPKLQSLDLSRAIFPKTFDLRHLADLAQLQHLDLSHYENSWVNISSTEGDLIPKLPSPLPNLVRLRIEGKFISKEQFTFLAKMPALNQLDLTRDQFDKKGLDDLQVERPNLRIHLTEKKAIDP